ncbi:hypothetical protein L1887_57879 [Cichorium endivia]|nr:hypothetical protein L1887_57879 [Cichorium endivia]
MRIYSSRVFFHRIEPVCARVCEVSTWIERKTVSAFPELLWPLTRSAGPTPTASSPNAKTAESLRSTNTKSSSQLAHRDPNSTSFLVQYFHLLFPMQCADGS